MADRHVKSATSREPKLVPIPYSDYFNLIEEKLIEAWNMQWQSSLSKSLEIKNCVAKCVRQSGSSRREGVIYNRLRAGHTHITHSYLMDGEIRGIPPACERCGVATVTVKHILVDCLSLTRIRRHIYGTSAVTLSGILGRTVSAKPHNFISTILGFMTQYSEDCLFALGMLDTPLPDVIL